MEYRLPVLLTKTLAAYSPNDNLVGVTEEAFQRGVAHARAAGFAIFDAAIQTTWGRAARQADRAGLPGADRGRAPAGSPSSACISTRRANSS